MDKKWQTWIVAWARRLALFFPTWDRYVLIRKIFRWPVRNSAKPIILPMLLMIQTSDMACINATNINNVDLAGSTASLTLENVFVDSKSTTQKLNLYPRTQDGRRVQSKNIEPVAQGCVFVQTTPEGEEYTYTCQALGLQPIIMRMRVDQKVVELEKTIGYVNAVPANAAQQIPLAWPILLQITPQTPEGQMDSAYQGTVQVTSSDPLAQLPPPYGFQLEDYGVHFSKDDIQLRTVGTQSVSFLDSATGLQIQTDKSFSLHPLEPQQIVSVGVQSSYIATSPIDFSIRFADAYGSAVDFSGTVTLSGPDVPTPLVYDVQILANQAYHISDISLPHVGLRQITLEAHNSLSPQDLIRPLQLQLLIKPGPANQVTITSANRLVMAGRGVLARLQVQDRLGNLVPNYQGSLSLQSSDGMAVLPDVHFTGLEHGVQFISLSLYTAGEQTVDLAQGSPLQLNQPLFWQVTAAEPHHLTLSAPQVTQAGQATTVTVTLHDVYGNRALTAGIGPYVVLASSQTTLQSNHPFTLDSQGSGQLHITLTQASDYTLVASSLGDGTLVSDVLSLSVMAASCSQTDWSDIPPRLTWRQEEVWNVRLMDDFGNPCQIPQQYRLLSNDGNDLAVLPQNIQLTAQGELSFTLIMPTVGQRQLHVEAMEPPGIIGQSYDVEVLRVEKINANDGFYNHNCVLLSNREVKCWGSNLTGRLGIGDSGSRGMDSNSMGAFLPAMKLPTNRYAIAVHSGFDQTCAVLDNGGLICYGVNHAQRIIGIEKSQVGDQAPLTPVLGGQPVVHVAVGYRQVCAVVADGRLSCWGAFPNTLGYPNNIPRAWSDIIAPEENLQINLGSGQIPVQVAMNGNNNDDTHHCVVLANQHLKCWGEGWGGTLGYGDFTSRIEQAQMGDNLPYVPLGTGKLARQVATGFYSTTILLTDGTIKRVGRGSFEPSGYNDTIQFRGGDVGSIGDNLPVLVFRDNAKVQAINSSRHHTCALFGGNNNPLLDQHMQCWGYNGSGELGMGDTINRGSDPTYSMANTPLINVGTHRTVLQLSSTLYGTCVLLDTHQVKCWGHNYYGELGIESTVLNMADQPFEMGDDLPALRFW